MDKNFVRLSELQPGEAAVVEQIVGDDSVASRLMEMGILDGEEISMIGRAPMGDPTEFAICGYRISLRNTESARVLVTKIT